MNERIKELRKALNLTQEEFAKRLKTSRSNIAGYEAGTRTPSTAVISLICREFDVREEWLKDDSGEMFIKQDNHSDIIRLTRQLLREEQDSFKNRFISAISKLTPEQWELLEQIAENISKK